MKVFIEKRSANTGKGKFFQRLVPELEKLGIEIIRDPKEPSDIYLDTGRFHCKPKAKKCVLRLGSPHFNSAQNIKKLNKPKIDSMVKADGVVYQSKFVKKACHKYLGKHDKERVIYNGADQSFYFAAKRWQSPYRFNFCAVTRKWIKQKRLKEIIKIFKMAKIYDSCLLVAGEVLGNEKKYAAPNIKFLGNLDDRQLARVYRASRALIHMVYLDACPNSAVEALCSGIPVISGTEGGAPELATHHVKEKKWDFKPIDLEKPPKIYRHELSDMLKHVAANPQVVYSDQVQISKIAYQYVEFFNEVLQG